MHTLTNSLEINYSLSRYETCEHILLQQRCIGVIFIFKHKQRLLEVEDDVRRHISGSVIAQLPYCLYHYIVIFN